MICMICSLKVQKFFRKCFRITLSTRENGLSTFHYDCFYFIHRRLDRFSTFFLFGANIISLYLFLFKIVENFSFGT